MNYLKRFISYYKPHLPIFLLDMFCATVVAAVDVAFPMVTQYLLRTLLPQMQQNAALVTLFVRIVLLAFAAYCIRAVMLFIVMVIKLRKGRPKPVA